MASDPLDFVDDVHTTPASPSTAGPGYRAVPPPQSGGGDADARASAELLDGLNPAQREAVETLDGPVLVLAGAGTGKTRALTHRLAWLLLGQKATPWQVMAVTFTNKAAREMQERVAHLLGGTVDGWWLGTFHALAARMLRRHAELVGLQSNFTILDADDQLRLVKQILELENLDSKKWPPRHVLGLFERWKDRGLTPDRVPNDEAGEANGRAGALYVLYQERLRVLNACDFGDLLLHMLTIFQNHADILADYHRRFRYLLVDEYQDTNVAQYLWLRLLAQGHRNLCCVGDEDQSIYGWRGAEIGNILRFEHDFPGARVVRLEENYRSTGHILGAASGLIAHNRARLGKKLWTDGDQGAPVKVHQVWDGEEEARWIGEEIESLQRKGTRPKDIAILVRAGFQTREFEERFIALGLPYRIVGGLRFYERQEIRDAIAYLRLVVQPSDDLAFERVINLPKRGIGPAVLSQLGTHARARGIPLAPAAVELLGTEDLRPKVRTTLRGFFQDLQRWREALTQRPHVDVAQMVLDESGYTKMWQEDKSPEAPGRLDNLKEFINSLAEFESLPGFLEHVALVADTTQTDGDDLISVMTLHGAKGLEFKVVFLPGWEEGLFPNQRALEDKAEAGLEEERRLAYVGLTRARRLATVTFAKRRRLYSGWVEAIPSRFVTELPRAHILTDAPLPQAGGGNAGLRASSAFRPLRPAGPPGMSSLTPRGPAGPAAASLFPPGSRVTHPRFGTGTVAGVSGNAVEIAFDRGGVHTVIASFIKPAP